MSGERGRIAQRIARRAAYELRRPPCGGGCILPQKTNDGWRRVANGSPSAPAIGVVRHSFAEPSAETERSFWPSADLQGKREGER